jgi:antirestriction protein ArdC
MQLHVEITNRILAELEKGTVPCVKPWAVPSPYNAATQHRYSGVNVLLLWGAPYQRPAWLTFRQAATLAGRVKKGEHATPIVYVSTITKTEGDEEKEISFFRRYHVFNVEQVEGLPGNLYAAAQASAPNQVEEFFAGVSCGRSPRRHCRVLPTAERLHPTPPSGTLQRKRAILRHTAP